MTEVSRATVSAKTTGCDHLHVVSQLTPEANHQAFNQRHVAEEDPRLHRHRRVRADCPSWRRDLDPIQL